MNVSSDGCPTRLEDNFSALGWSGMYLLGSKTFSQTNWIKLYRKPAPDEMPYCRRVAANNSSHGARGVCALPQITPLSYIVQRNLAEDGHVDN